MRKLDALTGIRFFAALWVVLYHFGVISVTHEPGWQQSLEGMESVVAGGGYMGVSLFFVLSGFILAYNYVTPGLTMRHGARAFWVARVARVYPIYLVGLLLAIVPTFSWTGCSSIKLACGMGDRPFTVLSSLTLLQSWTSGLPIRWNQPGWSLSVEATFYLLFPLIVIPLTRLATRRSVAVIIGLWLLGEACVFIYLNVILQHLTAGGQSWLQFMMFNPLIHLPEFLIGVVLCRAFALFGDQGVPESRILGIRNNLVVVAVVVLTLLVMFSGLVPDLYLHSGFVDLLFALGIYALATGEGRAAVLLSTPTLVLLGEASYGMYIFHVPLADWLIHGIQQSGMTALNPDQHLASFVVIYLTLLIAFSIASFVLIEQPARRAIRRAFAGRRSNA